jgi:hypothetical protein
VDFGFWILDFGLIFVTTSYEWDLEFCPNLVFIIPILKIVVAIDRADGWVLAG